MTINALLFDKDGTLFHFEATWAGWTSSVLMRLAKGDKQKAGAIGRDIGFDLGKLKFDRDSVAIAGTPAEIVEALQHHVSLSALELEDILNEEAANTPQSEVVDLAPYLSGLRSKGLRLGVATNDSHYPATAHLNDAGITALFDFISGYDSGHGVKPDPGPCLAFCKAVNLPCDQAAMVGDSLHDLRAGRGAGMKTIAVLTGIATAQELAPFADVVLDHIGQIPAWLEQEGL